MVAAAQTKPAIISPSIAILLIGFTDELSLGLA
jgi:hypothetical protein